MASTIPSRRWISLAAFLVILVVPFRAGASIQRGDCDARPAIEWREQRTQSFAILYPAGYEILGEALSTRQADVLDREYDRFAALFETSLALPVSIRIYPTVADFTCLNAQAEQVSPSAIHSRVGAREIALFGDQILAAFAALDGSIVDLIRYELGLLFTRQASGGRLPAGLEDAIGHYLQDPAQTIGQLRQDPTGRQAPPRDWADLWEEPAPQEAFLRQIQATSTVAFLVDTYGWAPFLAFLHGLPAAQGYRLPLANVYGKDLARLEEEWRAYIPRYFQGRWQAHPLYNFDLEPMLELIRAGDYAEADRKLQGALRFLEKTHQPEKLDQARALLAIAQKGQDAERLAAASLQAFQAGDYERSLGLAGEAERLYAEIGSQARAEEIAFFRGRVDSILARHADLALLQRQVATEWNTFSLALRLVALGRSLGELGDARGLRQVQELARAIESRQRAQHLAFSSLVLALVLLLLALRLWLQRRRPPPEAEL